jgi:hypothetical protein
MRALKPVRVRKVFICWPQGQFDLSGGTFRSIKTGKLLRQRRGNKDKVVERVLYLLGCAGDTGHTVQIKVGG